MDETSAENVTPWEPPTAGDEVEHVVGSLTRLRTTFRWKADGLDAEGLSRSVGDSALTLGNLLKAPRLRGGREVRDAPVRCRLRAPVGRHAGLRRPAPGVHLPHRGRSDARPVG